MVKVMKSLVLIQIFLFGNKEIPKRIRQEIYREMYLNKSYK
jgi:hypothetical protein